MSHRIAYVLLAFGVAGTAVASGCAQGTVDFEGDGGKSSGSNGNGTSSNSNSASASSGNGGAGGAGGDGGNVWTGSTSSGAGGASSSSSSSAQSSSSASSSANSSVSSVVSSVSSGGPVCGDAFCDLASGEDCATCAVDCGPCGPVCGDAFCEAAGGEDCTTCPGDCGACGSCSHDVCDTGVALVDGCNPCVTQVCAADSYCCTTSWDSMCVDEVTSICGLPCNGGGCAHDKCIEGGPLIAGCDPCVTQICQVDSFCCDTEWDIACVNEVFSVCFESCP